MPKKKKKSKQPKTTNTSSHLSIHTEKNLCKGQVDTFLPNRISRFSKFKHFWHHHSSYSCVERMRLWNLPVAISENSPANGPCLSYLLPSAGGRGWLCAACLLEWPLQWPSSMECSKGLGQRRPWPKWGHSQAQLNLLLVLTQRWCLFKLACYTFLFQEAVTSDQQSGYKQELLARKTRGVHSVELRDELQVFGGYLNGITDTLTWTPYIIF